MSFESVARVRVMGVDRIHVYPFKKIVLLIWVLKYSIYSMFCFIKFCKFRVLVYSVLFLEYSMFSAIPFRHSASPPFCRIGSPPLKLCW